ncbi:MAG: ABC transporter permease [Armatimonadetes bacterium]|nr:ABC transporter permease [Armatimonadota bacterium]
MNPLRGLGRRRTESTRSPGAPAAAALLRILSHRDAVLAVILALAILVACLASPVHFPRASNLLEILRLATEAGIIAVGMTVVIITAGIDLSVGSTLALCAVVLGKSWHHGGLPIGVAALLAVIVGTACGAFNGLLITRFGLPPLIITLATMALYRGLALGLSRAEPVHGYPDSFLRVGQGVWEVGPVGVPVQLPVLLFIVVAGGIVVSRTYWGRWLYAIGRNELAAGLAGVPVRTVKLAAYTALGLLSGLASVIYVSRVSTAKADAGTMLELDVITACVLGGVSIFGGEGSVWGAMLGLLIVAVARRGMDLAQVPSAHQSIMLGLLLILAVAAHSAWSRAMQRAVLERAGAPTSQEE